MTLDFWAPAIDKGASGANLGPTKEGIAGHITSGTLGYRLPGSRQSRR